MVKLDELDTVIAYLNNEIKDEFSEILNNGQSHRRLIHVDELTKLTDKHFRDKFTIRLVGS